MGSIRSNRELKVWTVAMDTAMVIFNATRLFPSDERFSLTDQIRHSSRSVPAQISEAWRKRPYPAAFVSKLNDAEGETAETQTHLEIARGCGYLPDAKAAELDSLYEEILSMLTSMRNNPNKWCL